MAGEITLPGQFAKYGGPQVTLLGSTLGNAVVSILTREGTGSTRGWRIFDPTKADFLNTKKILYPGDDVLVNAKVLPMDFPIQVASPEVNEIRLLFTEAGVQSAEAIIDATHTGNWTVVELTGLITPQFIKNGSAPATIALNQAFTFAAGDVLQVEGNVATTGVVRLRPAL